MKWIAASLFVVLTCFHLPAVLQAQSKGTVLDSIISPESVAAVSLHPKALLELESMELFPHEVLEAYGKEQLGINLKQATDVSIVVEPPGRNGPPRFGMVIQFDEAQTFRGVFEEATKVEEIDGNKYYGFGPRGEPMAISFRGDRTMFVGTPDFIASFDVKRAKVDGPLQKVIDKYPATKLVQFYGAVEPVRDLMIDNLPPANQVPQPFQGWLDAPELADYAYINLDLADTFKVETRVGAVSEKAAKQLRRLQAQSTQMAKAGLMMELANNMSDQSPGMQEAVNTYVERVMEFVETTSKPEVVGNELVYKVGADSGAFQVATIGILTGMLLPAVQQVRFAARRTQSMNNLRQLALAALNYESAYQKFPQHAIYSDDGEPLLSWRVAVLPFIEQNQLYEQFHLDEPWDSPHNIELLDQMPEVYMSPNAGDLEGKTVYQCFTGDQTIFPSGADKKVGFGSITDGTSNTILFVEANPEAAVEWSKPADIPFDPDGDVTAVGNATVGGFPAVFSDGSSHFISKDIDQKILKYLIMMNDGNVVQGF